MNALLFSLLLGGAPLGEAVVLRTAENMYSAPSVAADVVSQAYLGQVVTLLETRDGFARVETPDRYPGWLALDALRAYPGADEPRYAKAGPVLEVTSLMALVYRETDVTLHRPLAAAPITARLERGPEAARPGWLAVRLPDGQPGFVQQGDVRPLDAAHRPRFESGPELVATGRRLLGVPYLWGGMTPLGVDCSGFVSLVYRAHGRILPRDAGPQFDDPEARPVERSQLAPGDLVFFGAEAITHVGLYAGEGRFLNATTHEVPAVQEDALDDPHWTPLYRGARRWPPIPRTPGGVVE